jgi:hypothetical protein
MADAIVATLAAMGVAAAGWGAPEGAPIPTAGIITRLGRSEAGRWAAGTADEGPNGEAQLESASAARAAKDRTWSAGLIIVSVG